MDAVVAVYADWGIGAKGTQPVVLRADRAHFAKLTKGAAVIVGRRTMEDFPGGRPLKGRVNIVLSRSGNAIPGAMLAPSAREAMRLALPYERVMVLGGESVFREMLPYVKRVFVTMIDLKIASDSYFPNLDAGALWQVTDKGEWQSEGELRYRFDTYERI